MASILAKQDQENAVYGRQQVAASKPLNQIPPKTPGTKAGKVAFNDDNNLRQTQGKTISRRAGNENLFVGATKGAKEFATPAAGKNRAPLGVKTTNAKAKPFSTPALLLQVKDTEKAKTGSATRRNKLKIAQSEPAKINVLESKEDDVPEIEYMPPRARDLPDVPEELENGINLSMFENGGMQRDFFKHMWHSKGTDGKSAAEREQEQDNIRDQIGDAEEVALEAYRMDLESITFLHEPDCPSDECADMFDRRQQAKERYEKSLVQVRGIKKHSIYDVTPASTGRPSGSASVNVTKGPSIKSSREAATALAMAKPPTSSHHVPHQIQKPQSSRINSLLYGKPTQSSSRAKPSNPSSMRHTASIVASNTTLGYGKGRAVRTNLRKGILAPKDSNIQAPTGTTTFKSQTKSQDLNNLPPAEYMRLHGEPKFLSEMWWKCKTAGLIKMPGEDGKPAETEANVTASIFKDIDVEGFEREEAERDFELMLP